MSCAHKCPYTNKNCIHPLPFCEAYKDKFPTYESFKCKVEVYDKQSESSKTDYIGAKQTQADRIRAMSDEELAEWFADTVGCKRCNRIGLCKENSECKDAYLQWLKSEVKE